MFHPFGNEIETGPLTVISSPKGGGLAVSSDVLTYNLPSDPNVAVHTRIEHWLNRGASTIPSAMEVETWTSWPTPLSTGRADLLNYLQTEGIGPYVSYTWRRVRVFPVSGRDANGAWVFPQFTMGENRPPIVSWSSDGPIVASSMTFPVQPSGPSIRRVQEYWKLESYLQPSSSYSAAYGAQVPVGFSSDAFVSNNPDDPAYVPGAQRLLEVLAVAFLADPTQIIGQIPSDQA